MEGKATFWERIEGCPLWRLILYVFLFALSERLVVTLIFFLRWGWHTVSGIELWFYYGVAKGTFDLYSVWDPTWWILKVLGALLSGPALLYGTYLTSSLCSSLNAALFCLFVSELHNKKTGFLAGLIYGSMVLPMFNSAGTVTHDIFAYPYLILSLYGVLMVFKRKGSVRFFYGSLCLVSLFLGIHVGPTILVGAGTIVIYLLWRGTRAVFGRSSQPGYVIFGVFLALIIGVLILLYFEVMPSMMEKIFDLAEATRGIDVRAQIKAGSGDLLASSLGDYWLRFNFLLFFLPIGVYLALKKKDMLGLALLMVAFLASRTADRGTRPLSFGFALMGALAFVNWRSAYSWILAVWMCFIIGLFGGKYSTEYAVFFPVTALFIYYSIQWPRRDRRSSLSLMTVAVSLLGLGAVFIFLPLPSLRDSLGIFDLPGVPGGLLRSAPGFAYLFILFSLVAAGLFIYLWKLWIVDGKKPKWIWAIFSLTALWMLAGGVLGGLIFQAKELGKPDNLKLLEGIKTLEPARQVEVMNEILSRLNLYIKTIRNYWSVQVCLLVPGLLMILLAATRPLKDKKAGKQSSSMLEKGAFCLLPILGLLFLFLGAGKFWTNLCLIAPPFFGVLIFLLLRSRNDGESGNNLWGVAVVCWLFATVIPSMNQTAKSTEGEYRLYKWLGDHVPAGGRIFVPWSDGYMAEAISGLDSELSPENIDFQLPRLYWMPEETAARALEARGLNYIVVSSKYFKLIRYNNKTGEFQYSFSPDIIFRPQQMGINNMTQLKESTLYRLLYRPRELKHFRLLHFERDPSVNEAYLVYQVAPQKK